MGSRAVVPDGRSAVVAAMVEDLAMVLSERDYRLLLGAGARALGHGGIKLVASAAGAAVETVSRGVDELSGGPALPGPVRAPGGGRKPAEQVDPGLLPALLGLVKPFERGDPESPLRWVAASTREVAEQLTGAGHEVSDRTVARLLTDQGFTLQANARVLAEGAGHRDRDAQFCHINDTAAAFLAAGQPVVSVDTKKKEVRHEVARVERTCWWEVRLMSTA
jgi:Rhodopirellula transposase DDE domain